MNSIIYQLKSNLVILFNIELLSGGGSITDTASKTVTGNISGVGALNQTTGDITLQGTNTFQGGTNTSGGKTIFDGNNALPATGNLKVTSNGGIGTTSELDQTFLDRFDKSNSNGNVLSTITTANNLDFTGFDNSTLLGNEGTAVSGQITTDGDYRFGSYQNGASSEFTVSTVLSDSKNVVITEGNVALTGANTYTGSTTVANNAVMKVANLGSISSSSGLDLSNGGIIEYTDGQEFTGVPVVVGNNGGFSTGTNTN